jgi:hypothetical protein
MPYIGKVDVKATDLKRFSVTGSTSATHALSWTAPSEQSLIITINGVKQQDGAYTIAGTPTTITLSSALVATDEMEVIGISDIGQSNTVAQNSITADSFNTPIVNINNIIGADYSIPPDTNAISAGPITIASGKTVTVNLTSNWAIL